MLVMFLVQDESNSLATDNDVTAQDLAGDYRRNLE
jgi:hypothetical protein